jgi:hypothetical protein
MNPAYTDTMPVMGSQGQLGTIQFFDAWASRKSIVHAKDKVSKVMAICYGREITANPDVSWKQALTNRHLSVFEHIPVWRDVPGGMAANSLRHDFDARLHESEEFTGSSLHPASTMLVTAPFFVVRQWFRHRIYAVTEMSRRYTPSGRVPWEFYGKHTDWHEKCVEEYEARIACGETIEEARNCMPLETMTKFWWTGYHDDLLHTADESSPMDSDGMCGLRTSAHAQKDIRQYANIIQSVLSKRDEGNTWKERNTWI